MSTPDNVVVLLLDSLNRHMLGAYGGSEFDTPNLDRLATRSVRFHRHHSASLPCMPARHDLLCGAWDFLWKPWGSIEIWEDNICHELSKAGIPSQLISDHPHLFETGGENYHTDFRAWDYVRGHEGDPWRLRPDPSWVGAPTLPAASGPLPHPYDHSRTWFRDEGDFPGPKTMAAAADWLDTHAGFFDRFFLFVDEFDPHEPFDTPEPWTFRYHDQHDTDLLIWPPYSRDAVGDGALDEAGAEQVRANYGAKLSMIDHWLGRVLDTLDLHAMWEDTAVILCTDHGHYLGENGGAFGKPGIPVYDTLGHIPLLVAWPGIAPRDEHALTTTVDLHATIADVFGVTVEHRTHGSPLTGLIEGADDSVRDWLLQGYFGRHVNIIDRDGTYQRAAENGPGPISMWSNRWSTMPVHAFPELRLPRPDQRAFLDTMPGTDVPVIRQPFEVDDLKRHVFLGYGGGRPVTQLFDVDDDPQTENLAGTSREQHYLELLRHALDEIEAPDDQFVRLGLT